MQLPRERARIDRQRVLIWLSRYQGWLIFAVGSLGGIALAAWLSFVVGLAPGDALSRTYSAMMVIHSRFPHLAALGFIWPPLPALAQLPFMLLPQFTYYGFSGGIVTALAAGALLATLNGVLRWARLRIAWRLLLLALFALNPMWFYYAGNGMSEMPFLLFFTLVTAYFLRWQAEGHWNELLLAGLMTALMFGCRYDAIAYAVTFAAVMLWVHIVGRRRINPTRIEANLLAYLVPVIYIAFLWVFFNWQFMGDALYFLRSEYSNVYITRHMANNPQVLALQSSWAFTFRYLLLELSALSSLFLALVPLAIFQSLRRRDVALVGLLLLSLVIPFFQLVMYRGGQTFGFLRFYMSVQPTALLLAAYLLREWRGWARRVLLAMVVVGLASGAWVSFQAMQRTEDKDFAAALMNPSAKIDNYADDHAVGVVLRQRFTDEPVLILTDSRAEEVVLFSQMPKRFILPSDLDFEQALAEPTVHADYILIGPHTGEEREFHAVHERYPNLYDHGGEGLRLDSQIGEFRLYRSVYQRHSGPDASAGE